jgi:hypothetical protein
LIFNHCLVTLTRVQKAIYVDVGQKRMRPSISGMRRQWGSEVLELVDEMWAQEPNKRLSAKAVLERLDAIYAEEKSK